MPDPIKYYGEFGGQFLPELLMAPIHELSAAFEAIQHDLSFNVALDHLLKNYAGRETPLTEVKRFSAAVNGPRIFLKREDLLHTGAHKINNALGQCLLAQYMGKTRIIAETGAGQHGVATATACALLGLDCDVYMGAVDIIRQGPNVDRMRLLGATIHAVEAGSRTLKEAVNEAMRDWAANFGHSHYCLGSALGPYPYPQMVAYFQRVIGDETRVQCLERFAKLPDRIIACVGGGSNAIGMFTAFLDDTSVSLIGVEAGGKGQQTGEHAARFLSGRPGVLHGCYSYVLQNEQGQIANTHSISAGLDYPMVGPQHAALFDNKRVHYASAQDNDVLEAFALLARTEGIIPALESSHALAYVAEQAHSWGKDEVIVINLSGRGDKDMQAVNHE